MITLIGARLNSRRQGMAQSLSHGDRHDRDRRIRQSLPGYRGYIEMDGHSENSGNRGTAKCGVAPD